MKRVICDECRLEVEPDGYGLAPKGWLSVTQCGDYGPGKDFCSKACAIRNLSIIDAEVPVAPAAAQPAA